MRPRRPASARGRTPEAMPRTWTVTRLGAGGDGIAEDAAGPVYLPGALPGETVLARPVGRRGDGLVAEVLELERRSPERVPPPCPHFGACGSCAVQHLEMEAYAAWKRDLVLQALARVGLESVPVAPLARPRPAGRRRAGLAAIGRTGGTVLGFQERASHRIHPIGPCPALMPELEQALPALRALGDQLLESGERADFAVTATATGLDLVVERARPLGLADREALAAAAEAADWARVSWRAMTEDEAEPVLVRRPPQLVFGGVPLVPPAGGFLQAVPAAEALMQAEILEALAGARQVLDLFAGCGTFSLPLAATGAAVTAVDVAGAALLALAGAAHRLRVTTIMRDLFRRPLAGSELSGHDAILLDPPRAGARAQAEALAAAAGGAERLVMVSCAPASFARDARCLAGGGWRLEQVLPIDQFRWTGHVELIGRFRRT